MFMPNGINIIFIQLFNLIKIFMKINHLTSWMIIILMAALIALMLVIIRHNNSANELNQRIYDHSEITDTV